MQTTITYVHHDEDRDAKFTFEIRADVTLGAAATFSRPADPCDVDIDGIRCVSVEHAYKTKRGEESITREPLANEARLIERWFFDSVFPRKRAEIEAKLTGEATEHAYAA